MNTVIRYGDRLRQSKLYDVLIAAPWIFISAYVAAGHLANISFMMSQPLWFSKPWPHMAMMLGSRLGLALFFLLQFVFILTRTLPKRRTETPFPKIIALIGATLGLAFSLIPTAEPNAIVELASIALILVGAAAAVYSLFVLGRSFSLLPEARELATVGPYRFVRHPLYASELIMLIGVGMQFQLPASVFLIAAIFGLLVLRMGYEETLLSATFPAYADYARQTKRLIPWVY